MKMCHGGVWGKCPPQLVALEVLSSHDSPESEEAVALISSRCLQKHSTCSNLRVCFGSGLWLVESSGLWAARNLRELRMEKVQLDKQTRDMEIKLEELRERMSQEKEEREKTGRARWRSSQPGVLGPTFHDAKTNKENAAHTLSPGKMKIRVLKDEPLPAVQKQMVAEPAVKTQDMNQKLRLRGRVCGQCEVQLAGLMCSECGEDYCVGCFVRFHQKGALQRHRMVPIQAQLQTPVTARDVLGRVQEQVRHQQSQLTPKSAQERETPEQIKIKHPGEQTHRTQVLFVKDGVDVDDEEGGKVEDSSLLRGYFDEEESARFFQEALKEWREKGRTGDAFRAGPTAGRPVSAMETQTEKKHREFIHLEFKEDTLSYMEKLLLKQSRRGQIEHFQSQSDTRHRPHPTTPPSAETDERSQKLTAERMEFRKYFTSLFAVALAEDAGKASGPAESCLRIVDLDEMETDAAANRSFGVEDENESNIWRIFHDIFYIIFVPDEQRFTFAKIRKLSFIEHETSRIATLHSYGSELRVIPKCAKGESEY
ncbi:Zinc finger B-box domain-containing protein 1 [Triplophysa tibetana]|uniref:Zinc finger B-box domain-containing protein 1 n=1 Tax=Triplophysa tibetana TaxID=1572043 RepID=A0A5A9NZY2_9TELE|nr:Zinc finger B-box domain-containing protein 1 [Triplophysa tibetana]